MFWDVIATMISPLTGLGAARRVRRDAAAAGGGFFLIKFLAGAK